MKVQQPAAASRNPPLGAAADGPALCGAHVRNPHPIHVQQAQTARFAGDCPRVAAKQGVKVAMNRDKRFAGAVAAEWVRLVALSLAPPRGVPGGGKVAVYATDGAFALQMRDCLAAVSATLPQAATPTAGGRP